MLKGSLVRVVVVCLLASASAFGGLLQITFNGTLSPSAQTLSNMIFVYQGRHGSDVLQLAVPVFPSQDPCGGCTFQASGETFAPNNWFPNIYSKYIILGIYSGGGLFIVTDPSFDLTGVDFDATFGAVPGEAALISAANGAIPWGFGTSNLAKAVLNANLNYGVSIPLVPNGNPVVAAPGKIWNFTSGVQNGTVSVSATIPAVPEPSAALLVLTGVAAFAYRRKRRPSSMLR